MSVRTPPPLPHLTQSGTCSLCGTTPLPGRRRSWCSDLCVWRWNAAQGNLRFAGFALLLPGIVEGNYWSLHGADMRQRGYRCACCGGWFRYREIEVDHIRPLWSLTPAERADIIWWTEPNLQLLCRPCHAVKTKREAGERGRVRQMMRRGQQELQLDG